MSDQQKPEENKDNANDKTKAASDQEEEKMMLEQWKSMRRC